ncbi:RuBisCO large subunit C-terminal-like domain-containing protein [Paremcibacter congregatus]|uniref:Ribulose 1,5-bisphosphate carboxylase large subunit n=1 Tax=Paremcibacter congregatus TaxID=2043170 RepID=A0A2G4YT10_9PROT|nr:RuBisCO large subunit C-terminal-like domain-containing protein [Paremcibacter congregatus]PHZ85390.1 ribulose 1,5-bisphosphate carboxylase large subunit [Paremcibacter congregatus]QDE27677.1 ribulose 1,5-bisphosphate carboxylase large subunit [Paremcibacter congregatus]
MIENVTLDISGERFQVFYRLRCEAQDVEAFARHICVEQTIEFPAELIGDDDIRRHVMGQVVSLAPLDDHSWRVVISYAVEITGFSLTQTMNVIFGNVSLMPGVRVDRLEFPDSFLSRFKGPRFGLQGLRDLVGEKHQQLYCSALKPMGLSADQLAQQAYQLALGEFHFIKDDHGLADQPFAPFRERVSRCVEQVAKANQQTGGSSRYVVSLNSPAEQIVEDAIWAKEQGVGGLLVPPGIVGFDMMRRLADDDRIGLPILCHPSHLGSYVASPDNGLSFYALFGQLARLAGADVSIYPNFGGRFSFTRDQCLEIVKGCTDPMAILKPIVASPGGGMNFSNVQDMVDAYGKDIMFLIGGALHKGDATVPENCRAFKAQVAALLRR